MYRSTDSFHSPSQIRRTSGGGLNTSAYPSFDVYQKAASMETPSTFRSARKTRTPTQPSPLLMRNFPTPTKPQRNVSDNISLILGGIGRTSSIHLQPSTSFSSGIGDLRPSQKLQASSGNVGGALTTSLVNTSSPKARFSYPISPIGRAPASTTTAPGGENPNSAGATSLLTSTEKLNALRPPLTYGMIDVSLAAGVENSASNPPGNCCGGGSPRTLKYNSNVLISSGAITTRPIQMSVGAAGLQGFRPTMEDVHISFINTMQTTSGSPVSLFGIFDGHCGRMVADLGARLLPKCLFAHHALGKNNVQALIESIIETDRLIFQRMGHTEGGSTLIAALVHNRMLFVACLGDARAVLYESNGRTIALSEDHKPGMQSEHLRIARCGGMVTFGRVCGCLAVSRALGDFEFKFHGNHYVENEELMVSNVAEVKQINLTDQSRFLILACDGLWDVLSNEDASTFVINFLKNKRVFTSNNHTGPEASLRVSSPLHASSSSVVDLRRTLDDCAKKLAEQAVERGSMDNVSVVIICFHSDIISDLAKEHITKSPLRKSNVGTGILEGGSGMGKRGSPLWLNNKVDRPNDNALNNKQRSSSQHQHKQQLPFWYNRDNSLGEGDGGLEEGRGGGVRDGRINRLAHSMEDSSEPAMFSGAFVHKQEMNSGVAPLWRGKLGRR